MRIARVQGYRNRQALVKICFTVIVLVFTYRALTVSEIRANDISLKVKASKKSDEIKDIASKELINAKKKINKSDLKKKLLKYKNSKSYKEYKEKLNEF